MIYRRCFAAHIYTERGTAAEFARNSKGKFWTSFSNQRTFLTKLAEELEINDVSKSLNPHFAHLY